MYRMIPGIAFSKSQPHFFALKYSATNFVSTDAKKTYPKTKIQILLRTEIIILELICLK
jgi:hypothetical protein